MIWILCAVAFTFQLSLEIELNEKWFFPDYDFNSVTERDDLKRRFLDKKRENQNQHMRLQFFDRLSNNTVFSDNILHTKVDENNFNNYENMFRFFLPMNGVTYLFKRGFHWRTWRKINIDGSETVVCYKCNSYLTTSCSKCNNGYWVIDENPPCPYEIYSIIKAKLLCVINITQYYNPFEPCPQIITIDKLMETCNNPIETKWKILRNYSGSENAIKICQGRDSCELTTLYTINRDSITFRIINSTNHIFFSRVMKVGQNNYACMDDCGYITSNNEIVKTDKHVVFDLLHNIKNKRENQKEIFNGKQVHKVATPSSKKPLINKKIKAIKSLNKTQQKISITNLKELFNTKLFSMKKPINKKSQCRKIQEFYMDVENGSDYYDY